MKNPKLANLSKEEEYICKRCGHKTNRKDNMKRHIDRGTCQKRRK